jgi:hypothetical protein
MARELVTDLIGVHLEQRRVAGTRPGDQYMIDRLQPVEEPRQRGGIGRVERGRGPRVYLAGGSFKPVRIPRDEDDIGALRPGSPGSFKPNAGASADQDNGLPEQLRFALSRGRSGRTGHLSSSR